MKKTDFLNELHEMLEITSIDSLTEETVLKELEEYNSLFILTIIALVDEKFGVQLTAEQLGSITSIRSLMELIGLDKFED